MKNIQKKGQHSPVVQLFLKHLVSSNALFFIFPPQTLARVQRSAILRSQSRPREALLARTNYGKKKFASGRVFSTCRKIDTDSRSQLGNDTLLALLTCKINRDDPCYSFVPEKNLLKSATVATWDYVKVHQ